MTRTTHWLPATLLSLLALFTASSASAALLTINGAGQLTGATGVTVNGAFYDVDFRDGTCIELFNGCDDAADFIFGTSLAAADASQQLLDQVFLDLGAPDTAFDSNPSLTYDCSSIVRCLALTPWRVNAGNVSIQAAFNYNPASADEVGIVGALTTYNSFVSLDATWAVWREVSPPVTVPPPASLSLLLPALGALALTRRRPG